MKRWHTGTLGYNPSLLWLQTHKGSDNSRQSKIIEGYLMSEQSRINWVIVGILAPEVKDPQAGCHLLWL